MTRSGNDDGVHGDVCDLPHYDALHISFLIKNEGDVDVILEVVIERPMAFNIQIHIKAAQEI